MSGTDGLRLENQYWDRYKARFAVTAVVTGILFALLDAGGPIGLIQAFFGSNDADFAYLFTRYFLIGGVLWGAIVNLVVAVPGKVRIVGSVASPSPAEKESAE